MPLSETNKAQSQSIEDLIAQLDSPIKNDFTSNINSNDINSSKSSNTNRKALRGKRTTSLSLSSSNSNSSPVQTVSFFQRTNSNSQNTEPLLQKNIITSKKYSKNLKTLKNRGEPKKNGGGGKHTWGAPGSEINHYYYLDTKDPNYDSEEAGNVPMVYNEDYLKDLDVDDFELELKPIILEYFQNGDTIEVIDHLKSYNLERVKIEMITYLIQISLENNNTCKELMSRLLRDLTFEILEENDYIKGFDLLLKNLNELTLDNPDASEKSGTFIARAIADKVISRKYLERFFQKQLTNELPDLSNDLIAKSIESARLLVNMNDHLYQLSHIWGNKGGFLAVTELVDKIKEIIQELYDSMDDDEAIRCLKELNVPHFHHEIVFEALDFGLQKANDDAINLITNFLHKLCQSVIVTYDQLKIGVIRVIDLLPDISLDVPNANILLEKILYKCHSKGFINESIMDLLPSRSRKRFVSEGDGGRIKENGSY